MRGAAGTAAWSPHCSGGQAGRGGGKTSGRGVVREWCAASTDRGSEPWRWFLTPAVGAAAARR